MSPSISNEFPYHYQNSKHEVFSFYDCEEKRREIATNYSTITKGDILWVRETWQYIDFSGDENGYVYKASENGRTWEEESEEWKWRSPIHMLREAARIFLRVTNVRVERLQDITPDDIWEEGTSGIVPYDAFKNLWDRINKDWRYSFDKNPWVWVYEFKMSEKE